MLPRLLYLADVPVEATYHGSALLYRLLQRYPADRLLVIEGNLYQTGAGRRLPDVEYQTLPVGRRRLLNSRLHGWYSAWLGRRAPARAASVPSLLGAFAPQAILTVAHGYTWLTAARYAAGANLPLHLIVHDDWPRMVRPSARATLERSFTGVYRQAVSRLCTSPFMAEEYERRYGAGGTVLLPARAPGLEAFDGVAPRLERTNQGITVAFAGTVNSDGYVALLRAIAEQVGDRGGRLLIYGPLTAEQAVSHGLDQPHVQLEGLLPSDQLLHRLRADADVLFVPMSFAPDEQWNMRIAFPSKLTDYTAVGLPLLICGPGDCSAVRWANANPGVAAVVTSPDASVLGPVVDRLAGDAGYRRQLAAAAQSIGRRDFSAEAAEAIFHAALVA